MIHPENPHCATMRSSQTEGADQACPTDQILSSPRIEALGNCLIDLLKVVRVEATLGTFVRDIGTRSDEEEVFQFSLPCSYTPCFICFESLRVRSVAQNHPICRLLCTNCAPRKSPLTHAMKGVADPNRRHGEAC